MSEPSEWIMGGACAGIALLGAGFIALALYAERVKERREQWAAAHPHGQVEPPRVPTEFRFVERDVLQPEIRAVLDELLCESFERPPATDHDPAIGDFALAVADVVVEGKPVKAWIASRVEWPRDTYVRVRPMSWHSAMRERISRADRLDIPREAIVSVVHWTGVPTTRTQGAS